LWKNEENVLGFICNQQAAGSKGWLSLSVCRKQAETGSLRYLWHRGRRKPIPPVV